MEDKEVGERWRIYHDEAVVIELIRKLVEERVEKLLALNYLGVDAAYQLAFKTFDIDPATWQATEKPNA